MSNNKRPKLLTDNIKNRVLIKRIEKAFSMDKRKYYLVIKKCDDRLIHDLSNKIYNLQKELYQPFEIPLSDIKNILSYYCPFPLLFCLDVREAKYVMSELKKIDPDIFITVNDRLNTTFSIVLWNEEKEFISHSFDEKDYLDLAKTFMELIQIDTASEREITERLVFNLSKHEPVILFNNLSISEVLIVAYHMIYKEKYQAYFSVLDSYNAYKRDNITDIDAKNYDFYYE